jgi:anti-sigma B factor antagonist
VPLSLNTRGVGAVTIVRCSGRIVAGETEILRKHVSELLRDRTEILLHLGEIVFIDSSGLGTLVRLLTSTRTARGDLKLCHVPEDIHKVLKLTRLITLFDTYATEEEAVRAFYHHQTTQAKAPKTGLTVLCIDHSADVLAYLRELLGNAGYHVLTSSNLRDSLILLRATRPELTILGPNVKASEGTEHAFKLASAGSSVVELGDDFSTLEASQATSDLLEKLRALGHAGPAAS